MLKKFFQDNLIEAGIDEAGRGALVGPVFAAAVILPKSFVVLDIKDSKILSPKQRSYLKTHIEDNAIATSIGIATEKEIDTLNIEKATFLAMHRAIGQLSQKAELLIIDGSRFSQYNNVPHVCIVKGDNKYISIAAASILAKTYRDEYMLSLHNKHPEYRWDTNKGYPTKFHREIIAKYGKTPFHRQSFKTNFSKFVVQ
ncbi:MAG: ribonuclease HII [Solitalea-like symbiont of Acarus siro]